MKLINKIRAKNRLKQKLIHIYEKESNQKRKRLDLLFIHRCLFKCKHCFHWKKKNHHDSFELEDWMKLLDDSLVIYGNNVEVNIGGDGMALLNKYLIPLIKKSNENGFYTILNTNGYLINNMILKNLIDAGLDSISVSLDFKAAEKHDKHRGVKGSYNHLMKIFDYVKTFDYNITIVINCVIMKPNLLELVDIVKLVNDLETIDCINFQAITHPFGVEQQEFWYKSIKYGHLWPEDTLKIIEVIDTLINLKKTGSKISNPNSQLQAFKRYFLDPDKCISGLKCNVQDIGLHVFNDGLISICPYKENIGTLKKDSIMNLVSSKQAKKVYEQMNNCSKNCHQLINCKFQDDTLFSVI